MPVNLYFPNFSFVPQTHTVRDVSSTQDGVMTAADKQKLDSLSPDPSLAGDVTGTASANTVSELQGVPLTATGAAVGEALVFDGTGWTPAAVGGSGSAPIYGDGSDGAYVAPVGITSLSRDLVCTTFTVAAGRTVITNGFRIFATQSMSISGAIGNFGFDGSDSPDLGGDGYGGAAGVAGTLGGGGNGGNGSAPGGAGSPGGAAPNGSGGAGQPGFAVAGGGAGGAAGAATLPVSSLGAISAPPSLWGRMLNGSQWSGGGGGGGGGSTVFSSGGAGGGGGGGCILLASPEITLTSTANISVSGGYGGIGGDPSADGSGGPGGGGRIVFVTSNLTVDNDSYVTVQGGFRSGFSYKAADGSFLLVGDSGAFTVPAAPSISTVDAFLQFSVNWARLSGQQVSYWQLSIWGMSPANPNTTPPNVSVFFPYNEIVPQTVFIGSSGTFYVAMRGVNVAGAGLYSTVVTVNT